MYYYNVLLYYYNVLYCTTLLYCDARLVGSVDALVRFDRHVARAHLTRDL